MWFKSNCRLYGGGYYVAQWSQIERVDIGSVAKTIIYNV